MKPRVKRVRVSKSLRASGGTPRARSSSVTVEPGPQVPKMLILRGIAGHFAGRNWPQGALDEPSALAYAQRTGYFGKVLDVPGNTGAKSKQTLLALREFRHDQSVRRSLWVFWWRL